MRFGRQGLSYLLLKWGLGATFVWIGVDMVQQPDVWIGYLPADEMLPVGREVALKTAAAFDIVLGVMLFTKLWPRVVSGLVAIHLLGILIMHGVDAVLIRDVGLLGAALALLFWPDRLYMRKNISQDGACHGFRCGRLDGGNCD